MIHFIGAGPGDPDLITLKGRSLLEKADIVVYAGSLVSKAHLEYCKPCCQKYDSAGMTLEEVMEVMLSGAKSGKRVVRLHTGDPTIYGAIREQMDCLEQSRVEYEVVPGVSSFTASCAAIKREFTVPDVSQTVIITRLEGRTPVPELESLEKLASHRASMAIFLSVGDIERVVEKLAGGYGSREVPVAVVYKATWAEEKILLGTLDDIAEKVKAANVDRFAQILVGYFIEGEYGRSLLYHPEFTHGYRQGTE